MNNPRFAYQFFHFTHEQWQSFAKEGADCERLFREDIFSRRALKSRNDYSLAEAKQVFMQVQSWEERLGIRAVAVGSAAYPAAILSHIPPERRPAFLFFRGPDVPEEKNSVAIVGTRFPSRTGQEIAISFSAFFTAQCLHVVSGLARGIDTFAHHENLNLGTVAVLGGGVDDIYPKENSALLDRILGAGGTILSPFPLGQTPLPHNFPQRNELIAALSAGTVVVEGNQTSGAAVTGRQALEMGKCVVALTQDFRSGFGRGAISLQHAGAILVTSEQEALQAIFARFGGFSSMGGSAKASLCAKKGKQFSLQDFLKASGKSLPETLVLLEEGLASGEIEKTAPDRYRLQVGINARR